MLAVLFLIGFVIAVLSGIANGSMRRLIVGGALALLGAFLAFPFTQALGHVTRDTISPTLIAIMPAFPVFALIPGAIALSLVGGYLGGRMSGALGVISAVLALVAGLLWIAHDPVLGQVRPLYGLMEVVAALAVAAATAFLFWVRPKLRLPGLLVGLLLGGITFAFLYSPLGQTLFPRAAGYYKLLTAVPQGAEARLVETFNADLEQVNRQRQLTGLPELSPITSVADLEGQRIPRETAAAGYRLITPRNTHYGTGATFLILGLMLGAGLMQLWRPRLQDASDLTAGALIAGIILILTPGFSSTDFSFARLADGWPFLVNFLDRAWPPLLAEPEFNRFPLQEVASQMLITIQIALVGTFLAALFALPLSFFAARNLTQDSLLKRAIYAFTRGFFNINRGVDALILGLIFVAAVGLGPFAGVLAMAISSVAELGKLYSESIENVERGSIEALESVGASGTNVVRWAILPQVLPLFVAWTLYRFEINFRISIVLGLVGAGGIGFFIWQKMASGLYNQMIIAIIAVIIVVNIIDYASSRLREQIT